MYVEPINICVGVSKTYRILDYRVFWQVKGCHIGAGSYMQAFFFVHKHISHVDLLFLETYKSKCKNDIFRTVTQSVLKNAH